MHVPQQVWQLLLNEIIKFCVAFWDGHIMTCVHTRYVSCRNPPSPTGQPVCIELDTLPHMYAWIAVVLQIIAGNSHKPLQHGCFRI